MLPFCGHFYRVSHQQENSNKFKDFKIFECYDIQMETFELTTVEYWRMMKILDSETKIRITWWKYVQGTQKCVWFKWFFELWEFQLKEFSCKPLLVSSEGTKEFVWFRWSFELQEFELLEFNCMWNLIENFVGSKSKSRTQTLILTYIYNLKVDRQKYVNF